MRLITKSLINNIYKQFARPKENFPIENEYDKFDEKPKPLIPVLAQSRGLKAENVELKSKIDVLEETNTKLEREVEKYKEIRRKIISELINRHDFMTDLIALTRKNLDKNVIESIRGEKKGLEKLLKDNNISRIDLDLDVPEHIPFNPQYHEAIPEVIYRDDLPDGTIVKAIKPGYYLDGMIYRRVVVQISKKPNSNESNNA